MLIDEMRTVGVSVPKDAQSWDFPVSAFHSDELAVISADNVYEYLHFGAGDASKKQLRDFAPNIAPVGSLIWIEARTPKTETEYSGVLFRAIDFQEAGAGDGEEILNQYQLSDSEAFRWLYLADCFIKQREAGCNPLYLSRAAFKVSESGQMGHRISITFTHKAMSEDSDFWRRLIIADLTIASLCLSFMHCKNVTRIENTPDPKLQKARQRRNKPPLTKYYTLEIEPMKRILRTEGRSEEVGLKKALHICRGHFASYSEDKPLFGKVSGRFWIPAHVRGSKDAGEVKKDYSVKI